MGNRVDWYMLAYRRGFREPYAMLVDMRQKGMSYQEIAYELGCTKANVRFKCYEYLALRKITAADIMMSDEQAQDILRNLSTKYSWLAKKIKRLGGKVQ